MPFADRKLIALVRLPLISSIPHRSMASPPRSAHFRHTVNALPILSSSPHNDLTTSRLPLLSSVSALLLSTLLASYFLEKSSTAFCALNHLFHLSLMHLLHCSFFIFLLHVFQPFIPFLHGVLQSCMGLCFLTIFRKHLCDPPTVLGIHASF